MSTGLLLTELATGLAESGIPMRVYASRPSYSDRADGEEIPSVMHYRSVEIVRVPAIGDPKGGLVTRGLFSLSYLLTTTWALLRDRKQLSGVLNTTNPPFLGIAAIVAKAVGKIPFITIVHDIYPDVAIRLNVLSERSPISKVWSVLTNWVLNQSEQNTVLGRDMDEIIRAKLRPKRKDRTVLIPNWSDETRMSGRIPRADNPFAQEHNLGDTFVVQYSGRMGRTHNLEPLIEAAALLQDQPVRFQLIGDGAKRSKLKQMVSEKQLSNVEFLPYQPFEQLKYVLSAPDVAIVCLDKAFTGLSVPSKSYGVMASGTPILAFLERKSEIGLTVEEHQCGVVMPQPTGQQVADLIQELMQAPERVEKMGQNGYDAFCKHFTRQQAVHHYKQLIETHLPFGHTSQYPIASYRQPNTEQSIRPQGNK